MKELSSWFSRISRSVYRGTKMLFAYQDRERVERLEVLFVREFLAEVAAEFATAMQAAPMQLHPTVHTYARAQACRLHNRNALSASSFSSSSPSSPSSPPQLISLPSVSHFLSLSLSWSKRASLIMRKTDSTPDQRILRVRSPLS